MSSSLISTVSSGVSETSAGQVYIASSNNTLPSEPNNTGKVVWYGIRLSAVIVIVASPSCTGFDKGTDATPLWLCAIPYNTPSTVIATVAPSSTETGKTVEPIGILNAPGNSKEWENIFPLFTEQIAKHTGTELINTLSSDFSTTTAVEKLASEITIMEAMEPFFEFVVIQIVCGIPEITLKGTTEDWQKIYDKAKILGEYDLRWWTNELEPILAEFIKTSKGKIDKEFWRNMFKYHSQEKYGAPKIIDGWIIKFFPYDKDGKRNNLKELKGSNNLPEEIVKVDLKYIEAFGDTTKTTPLELWAGFIGLEQDSCDFSLTPQIGWMIRKKDVDSSGLKYQLRRQADSGISIRVKEIPDAIFELDEIYKLEISFVGDILIPDKLKEIEIEKLVLSGKIDNPEIERIRRLFPDTQLIINRKTIQ